MNAVLQALANLPAFHHLVRDHCEPTNFGSFSLTNFLQQLLPKLFEPDPKLLAPASLAKNISYVHPSFVPC